MAEAQNAIETELTEGILRFQREVYPARQQEYDSAAQNLPNPHTLLSTCGGATA